MTWEVGSPWSAVLRRVDRTSAPLPMTDPCRMEIRPLRAASTAPALLVLPGTLSTVDGTVRCLLSATAAQTRALGPGSFQLVLLLGMPGGSDPVIWARGYLRARDRTGDPG